MQPPLDGGATRPFGGDCNSERPPLSSRGNPAPQLSIIAFEEVHTAGRAARIRPGIRSPDPFPARTGPTPQLHCRLGERATKMGTSDAPPPRRRHVLLPLDGTLTVAVTADVLTVEPRQMAVQPRGA